MLDEFVRRRRQGRPALPAGYPTGFNFDVYVSDWDEVVAAAIDACADGSTPFLDDEGP